MCFGVNVYLCVYTVLIHVYDSDHLQALPKDFHDLLVAEVGTNAPDERVQLPVERPTGRKTDAGEFADPTERHQAEGPERLQRALTQEPARLRHDVGNQTRRGVRVARGAQAERDRAPGGNPLNSLPGES